jgi:hypothetical protein
MAPPILREIGYGKKSKVYVTKVGEKEREAAMDDAITRMRNGSDERTKVSHLHECQGGKYIYEESHGDVQ